MKLPISTAAAVAGLFFAGSMNAHAMPVPLEFDGILFPDGAASFADAITVIDAGTPAATGDFIVQNNALGTPDDASYSLGRGGSIVVEFIDNRLVGSGDDADDLFIFEIGPQVEDTFLQISVDGLTFLDIGGVGGATSRVDIDPFLDADLTDAFDQMSEFAFIRITDDPNEGGTSGGSVGGDIDAVGAISSRAPTDPMDPPVAVNAPATLGLFAVGLAMLSRRRRG